MTVTPMHDIKVGDKVKIVGQSQFYGREGTVHSVVRGNFYLINYIITLDNDRADLWFARHEIEKI